MRISITGVFLLLPALAAGLTQQGEWTMEPSDSSAKVRFAVHYSSGEGHQSDSSSDWSRSDFPGLSFSDSGRHDVKFKIEREAGTLECEGFLKAAQGAGLFTFTSRPQYSRDMTALGFPGFTDDKLFAATIHNVSTTFAKQMKSAGIEGLDAGKLIAFKIFDVSPSFVSELRATNVKELDADKLIAFRIHGVSPEYVQMLDKLGFAHPEAGQLIALRIHGVTKEYIQNLQSHGVRDLTLSQIIALRIQGIN